MTRDPTPRPFEAEEITGKYEGEELAEMRAARTHNERIGLLEVKSDDHKAGLDSVKRDMGAMRQEHAQLTAVVSDTRAKVGEVSGKLDVLPELVKVVSAAADRLAQREHFVVTAEVDVNKAAKLAEIKVDEARELDEIERNRANELAEIKRKKDRRKFWLAIVGLLSSGAGLIKLIELIVKHL